MGPRAGGNAELIPVPVRICLGWNRQEADWTRDAVFNRSCTPGPEDGHKLPLAGVCSGDLLKAPRLPIYSPVSFGLDEGPVLRAR